MNWDQNAVNTAIMESFQLILYFGASTEHRHYHQSPVAQIIRPAISNQKILIVCKWRFVPWDIWTPGPWSQTPRWGARRGCPWPPRRRRRRTSPSLTSGGGCVMLGPWEGDLSYRGAGKNWRTEPSQWHHPLSSTSLRFTAVSESEVH